MREGLVECKECKFWLQSVEEGPILELRLSDFGLCTQSRSVNWFLRMHKDGCCRHGELKNKMKFQSLSLDRCDSTPYHPAIR